MRTRIVIRHETVCRIDDERRFIDEIPANWPTSDPIQPACDFLCVLAEQDL